MNAVEFLPDPSLTLDEKKACCDIMRETGFIPRGASDNETGAIINWLNHTKTDLPNCMTFVYKDCCFQKMDGKWTIALKSNDFIFQDLLYKGE